MNQLDLAMVLEQCTKEYRFASWVPAKFSCNSAPKLVDLERISLNHFKFYGESSLCHFFAHTGVIEVFKTQHKWFNTAYEKVTRSFCKFVHNLPFCVYMSLLFILEILMYNWFW